MSLRLRRNRRGASNIIVVVLSLVIIVIIVSNIVLWSYEMNQLDWEKMKEDIAIVNVTSTNETSSYNPSEYALGGATNWMSGSVSDLTTDNGVYMTFRSYYLGTGTSDFVDETCDLHSPSAKGTHSNFTAQKYGPDSVYDTLTEENTGGTTGITPITAFQDTQQSTSSTSLVDANCGTGALSNGVNYLVIYTGNIGGSDDDCVAELILKFGATTIARGAGEGVSSQITVKHVGIGMCQGYYIVTGDGTKTLKFQFRCITSLDTAYAGAMGIIAIPLTELTQNSDYWYSVSNTEDIVTNPSTWTNLTSQTWNLPETGDYLILMSAEGGCDGGSTADAPMVRSQLNGVTLGSEYMEEWENNNDNMNFAKATVVNCNSGDNTFTIQVKDEDSSTPTADFHRPRIIVIKCSVFDQIVDTSTSTGVSTSSRTYVDWDALTTTYTPNQQEYVVVLANLNGLHNSYYHAPVYRIYDATASTAHREDSGEYGNAGYDTGHAAGADQLASIAVAVKQQSSATQWKVQIRTEDASTAYYSQTGTGTGHRSDLILWGLSVVPTNYELDLEIQWTNASYTQTNEELRIKTGNFSDSEDLMVYAWNVSTSDWHWVMNLTASSWNNVSVSSYLTSSNFTIRFNGGNETGDTTQDSWDIDVTLLHVWRDEYTLEVEFTGSSSMEDWSQLIWTVNSAWTNGSVNVTLQLYNYTLGGYSASGNGYIAYTSDDTPNTDENKSQTINVNPTHFRNATGYWKMKVKGVKATDTQFDFKADWIEFKAATIGTLFTFKNGGSLTVHLVSLWVNNSTHHQRYYINIFVNSADTTTYLRADISLPTGQFTVKVITERGNTAVYSGT